MAFTFNPRTELPTLGVLSPPLKEYPYFEAPAETAFEPDATDYSRANAWLLAEISLLAYASPEFIADFFPADGGPLKGFQFLPLGQIEDSGCFLLHKDGTAVVAFRGTRVPGLQDPLVFLDSLAPHFQDVVTDVQFPADDFKPGRVHHGFLDAYERLFPRDRRGQGLADLLAEHGVRTVWLTGHSLGGALATVAAARLGDFQGLYTYGCPRVGDAAFVNSFADKQAFRFVHHDDAVTRLPPTISVGLPPVSYQDLGELVFIDRDGGVSRDADPGSLNDVFSGVLDAQDVFRTFIETLGGLGPLLGGLLGPRLLDLPVPRGPVPDHAPVYYAMFLKDAASA